ncbi:MAG: HAMP domain-containing sensor histidine kinase [Myxococcota bacterium]
MQISHKLFVIVALTIVEISITVWSAFELSKGATFHQLNTLHLKYNIAFAERVAQAERSREVRVEELRRAVHKVRDQPIACLEQVNSIDMFIMRQIGTDIAVDICARDAEEADRALADLDRYLAGSLSRDELIVRLRRASEAFGQNSDEFEGPITETVSFLLRTLIPIILGVSLFNIFFITYLSRTISGSIQRLIELLKRRPETAVGIPELSVSGELGELLRVAAARIEEDSLNLERNHKLRALVDKRTESLRRANDELAQFAYRASHDLKGPLTSSRRLVSFILKDLEAGDLEEVDSNIRRVGRQLEVLEALVVDILALAKADLSEADSRLHDAATLMSGVEGRLKELFRAEECELRMATEVESPLVVDGTRLSQILENLVSNGLKYRDGSKAQCFVDARLTLVGDDVVLTVEDNGLGIPAEAHDEVFAMFKRFHPHVSGGSGLGLAIVDRHVERLGGTIAFVSTHEGTRFTVRLPNRRAA